MVDESLLDYSLWWMGLVRDGGSRFVPMSHQYITLL